VQSADTAENVEQTSDAVTSGSIYALKLPWMSGDTGNCIDVAGASLDNMAKIEEWDCNGTGAQSFYADTPITVNGIQYWRFKNTHSGKCLNVYGGVIDADHPKSGNQSGSKVQQYSCSSGDNNYWELVAQGGNGGYGLKSKMTSGDGIRRCMDVTGGTSSTANGTQIEIWGCNGAGNQTYNVSATTSGGGGGDACTYTNWVAGHHYNVGDIVYYSNSTEHYYICVNANDGLDPTISTWYWDPYTCGPGGTPPPTGGTGIAGVVTSSDFSTWFPTSGSGNGCGADGSGTNVTASNHGRSTYTDPDGSSQHCLRSSFYSYSALTTISAAYATFANSSDSTLRKREAAAFLANLSQESDWFHATREYNTANYCNAYCSGCGVSCPIYNGGDGCRSNGYYGRGPMQLSWPCNYQAAGNSIGSNLLGSPDLVATNADVSWKTAAYYWMTQPGPGGYGNNCHDAMMASGGSGGFGASIAHINGSQECPSLGGSNTTARDRRIKRYKWFCDELGVSYGNNTSC